MSSRSRWWIIRAAAGVALLGCAMTWQAFAPLIVAAMGLLLTWGVASRVTDDRVCLRLIVASYLVKVLLATVMFAASYYAWPFLREYQGGGGFWSFSDDSPGYSFSGGHLMNAWKGIASGPPAYYDNWTFVVYLGVLYFCFGEQPLVVTIFNAWYGSIIMLAALMILRRWRTSTSATRMGMALLGFLPSLLVWSTQVMKDPMTLALTMLGVCLMVLLTESGRHPRLTFVRLLGLFALLLFVLTLFRGYAAIALGIATTLACGVQAVRRWGQGDSRYVGPFLTISVMTLAVLVVAHRVDLEQSIVKPAYRPRATTPRPAVSHQAVASRSTSPVDQVSKPPQVELPPPPPLPPSPSPPLPPSPSQQQSSVKTLVQDQIHDALGRVMPQGLDSLREGFAASGGDSVMDKQYRFHNTLDVLWYLPRALTIAFFAPFPSQWLEISGRTKALRVLAAFEVLLIYLLFVGCVVRIRHLRSVLSLQAMAIWCFVFLVAVPMGITVANVGTLFRLRLQFLFPLILLLCSLVARPLEDEV